jgi:signal transduction histidine kinase
LESNGVSAEVKEKIDVIVGKNIPQAENYITTSVLKMDALLSGLLQISRLGRFKINKEELDMNETVSEILETINYQVEKAGVKMEISELPSCIGDKNQINQLFSNIIGNALKYLDSNRNGVISVSGKKEGDYSVYCVEDNGIGILPAHQEKIFEIFYQLKPEKSIGEGLGLTIVKKIIDIHHGKIWVDSEPNKGSKFYISLPS